MSKPEGRPEIPFQGNASADLGGLLGGVGGLLGNLFQLVEKTQEQAASYQGKISDLGEQAQGVFGVSVRVLGGQPVVERFGNIRPDKKKGAIVDEVREPLVDVFEEAGNIQVLAELPGVDEADISWELAGSKLQLRAKGRYRQYAREVTLPGPVVAEHAKSSYRNGIFQLSLERQSGAQ
ncbi:MAG: Hsp20/alpha crystallin family protein [Cyanobacteria bacterium NC_groundwater_1444_Ag_S-0.65um_54_12]|nr:Hsp20/alpha crystallin family protein [Cyanobacteria bacterium NC_groundwater_1444_Ag_S-0.65um_54_12]